MKITLNLDQYTFLEKEGALEKYKEHIIAQYQFDRDFSTTYEKFIDFSFLWPTEDVKYWAGLSTLYKESYKKVEELFTIVI